LTASGWTEEEFARLKGELSRISGAHQKLLKQVEQELAKLTYWDDNHPNLPVLVAGKPTHLPNSRSRSRLSVRAIF
jgi:hypothetical protein